MGKKNGTITFLKYLGLMVGSAGIGMSGAFLVTDGIDAYYKNKSDGLELLKEGAHMKEGNHRVVITDQFYDLLTVDTTEQDQAICIDGIKEAYTTLNKYNSGIQFELCTNSLDLSTAHDIKYIQTIEEDDMPLYLTDKTIDNNPFVLGETHWETDYFSREMKNLSITFKKSAMLTIWSFYKDEAKRFEPHNYYSYTITIHETMHAMGFAHSESDDSIMCAKTSYKAPHDLSEKDIENLAKYNYVFYGIEQNTQSQSQTETTEEAEAMAF